MLKTTLLHPGIAGALGRAGHGSTILISDGNYPHSTGTKPGADVVFLNLRPGLVAVDDILTTVLTAIPVESAFVMRPADGPEPDIFPVFRQHLDPVPLTALDRFAFYDKAREPDLALAIASGDTRLYANIILTIGVVS
ncbi:transporter [Asanoa ishikariensis]|uniref:L-fucose mutarotase n=1 Tax=Asanoa ishikariensis TaxID=137265 RepID=A0A1H3LPS9_9ACTN|nr:RbsD/FucU family protein [Asanoa ishikariensis]GIF65611.1 transporter [Asanoa ishikariensis]SDY66326.1 L-fucose mutarotase [Asanoa ishikariensis]